MSTDFQQSYKTRAEAYRKFIQPQGLPVSQSKFYQDAEQLQLVKPDKSIDLASLLAYVKSELKVDIATGQSLARRTATDDREDNDNRKAKAEADLKEIQAEEARRKLDEKWLHQDEAWSALAALFGTLRDTLRHHVHQGAPELVHLAGGDPGRAPEVYEGAEAILSRSFNEIVTSGRIEGIFTEDPQSAEEQ